MRGDRRFAQLVAVCLTVCGLTLVGGSLEPAAAQASSAYQWSVKYICGWLPPVPPDLDQIAKPGDYATIINLLNPTDNQVRIDGVARPTLSYRLGAPRSPIIASVPISLLRYRTLMIDCLAIWAAVSVPPGSFIEGYLHLGFPDRVRVSAVYTSQTHNDPNAGPDAGAGHSIDVEDIEPFVVPMAP